MKFIENLTCGNVECHFNHEHYCYREEIELDLSATCESYETCDLFNCNECEFFDFCGKEKKYNSTAFTENDDLFPSDEE